ncbi:MAG: Gmad2 immunoglobulin-like domain-containing protein [Candidatus Curtissbacteria bacterium]
MSRKYPISIAVASVILLILAIWGIFRLYQIKTTESVPMPTPSPAVGFEVSPLPSASHSPTPATGIQPETGPDDGGSPSIGISVQSPQSGTSIASPLKVQGYANIPQKEIAIVVKDTYGTVLGQGMATACFAKTSCFFTASVVFAKPSTQTGTIEVFSPSSSSGAKDYLQIIKVNF